MKLHCVAIVLLLGGLVSLPEAAYAANPQQEASAKTTAPKLSERRKQKNDAERERAELQSQLSNLKREINQTEAAKDSAADTLAAAEDAVSRANVSLRELQDEQKDTEQKLKTLGQQQKKLTATVAAQQKRLARWLRAQYIEGNEDRLKLLLSGDNPNRINRDLQYMSYLSQAQAKLLEELRANLAQVEQTRLQAEEARASLIEIAQEEQAQKQVLEQEKQRRTALLAQISKRLLAQRKEAGNLARDEQRLSGLVEKLAKLVEEQRKAEEAAAEKRRLARQAELAEQKRKQAQALALAQAKSRETKSKPISNAATAGVSTSARGEVKEEPKIEARPDNKMAANDASSAKAGIAIKNELVPQEGVHSASFASLRGQLRLPLRGSVAAKFGTQRSDGPSSKGLFIRAAEGEPVRVIAQGRVVFAEWLRGFGNLLIVDHGGQYMSIYGNNQTLLKRAGDTVKSGDTIANAGNSGGNEESGLYFEMRHRGRAFDPLGWVNVR